MGMLCANIASGVWLHIATYFKFPVSTTHSIIGAIIGFSLAYGGSDSIKWDGVWKIMLSWIISPILSGVFALIFYLSMKRFILNKDDAIERILKLFPILTLFTFVINTFFIFYKGTPQLDLDELPAWEVATIVICVSVSAASIAGFVYVPYARKRVHGEPY
jgi:sodium-dependent phosphate transporter